MIIHSSKSMTPAKLLYIFKISLIYFFIIGDTVTTYIVVKLYTPYTEENIFFRILMLTYGIEKAFILMTIIKILATIILYYTVKYAYYKAYKYPVTRITMMIIITIFIIIPVYVVANNIVYTLYIIHLYLS